MRLLASLVLAFAMTSAAVADTLPIGNVRTLMYQLQRLEEPAAVKALAESDYDLVVVEPTATVEGQEDFDVKAMVRQLHAGNAGRMVLAYLNPGQAESYRTYWTDAWKKPTKDGPGVPDFILKPDPDGWDDNYNVAYWDKRWQATFATGPQSEVRRAMAAGFDGVYLDWIDAFSEDRVVAEAKKAGVEPAKVMVDFLLLIRATNPAAVVVQQNAIYLIDADPRLPQAIDAIGVEDTWFGGKANAKWGSKGAGDVPNRHKGESSTAAMLKQYEKYVAAGKPVFTIDYCVKPDNAVKVYTDAAKHGVVPLVTQVSLDRLTETPPPIVGRK